MRSVHLAERTLGILTVLLMVMLAWGEPAKVAPVRAGRKQKPVSFLAPTANVRQFAEDFDREVNWEQKDNRGASQKMDFGYSSANHLSGASCAPGEIGGSVCGAGVSWFADSVSSGSVALNADAPLTASGFCTFTATDGSAALGWFDANTYAAPDAAPHGFIGWRQNGAALCAALGHTGSSFVDGASIAISNGKPFQWTLAYTSTGGENGCGQIALSIGGSSSTLSLTQEQRNALAGGKFNHFGIVTPNSGTDKTSTLWLDDLIYTKVTGLPLPHPDALVHTRTDFFDTDPTGKTWFGQNNINPHNPIMLAMDYKYEPTDGGSGYEGASGGGCIGGLFSPGIGTSYYGYDYGDKPLHLTDKLRSEGYVQFPLSDKVRLTELNPELPLDKAPDLSFMLGWTTKKAKTAHEPSTLALRFNEDNRTKGFIDTYVFLSSRTYQAIATFGGKDALPSVERGPRWYHYVLEYDPKFDGGNGSIRVEMNGKSTTFNLPTGKKELEADFDLFGMWNHKMSAGGPAIVAYGDDIKNTANDKPDRSTYDGSKWIGDFSNDPAADGWVGANNSFRKKESIIQMKHGFGWARSLQYLDGLNGYSSMYTIPDTERYCMGGFIYLPSYGQISYRTQADYENDKPYLVQPPGEHGRACAAYGADLGATLNARDHHLFASGTFKMDFGVEDAGELFGWFNSATACDPGGKGTWVIGIKPDLPKGQAKKTILQPGKALADKFLGVQINMGPAHGYAMTPAYRSPHLAGESISTTSDSRARVYEDGQWRDLYMEYDPSGAGGNGQIKIQVGNDGTPFTLDLEPGAKSEDFAFDRLGLLTLRGGGGKHHAIYFDKLTYTVASQ